MKTSFLLKSLGVLSIALFISGQVLGQCPAAGSTITADQTISANCTVTGNLIVQGATLTVNPGVTLQVDGTLTVRAGGTISGTGATIIADALAETYGGPNTISGGNYTVEGFATGSGGAFTMTGASMTISPAAAVALAGTTMTFTNSSITGITNFTTNVDALIMTNTDLTASGSIEFEDLTLSGGTISAGTSFTISDGTNSASGFTLNAASAAIRNTTISDSDINLTGALSITSGAVTFDNSQVDVNSVSTSGGTTLTVQNGSDFVITNGVQNQEDLIIDGAFMQIGGDLDATGGDNITVRNGGELLVIGSYQMNGGGIQLGVEGGSLVRVQGDIESSNGGNTIEVDDNSGIAVDGDFIGTTPPAVTVGTGDGTDCTAGSGCCGDPAACGTATVLPVSLISFSHTQNDDVIILSWSTASELNNDFFTIERSFDGVNFNEICTVRGSGTTNEQSTYSHSDRVPFSNTDQVYYRLSQTDFDGTHEILGIIAASISSLDVRLKIVPNPVTSTSSFELSGAPQNAVWSIYSMTGSSIYSGQLDSSGEISVEGMAPGTYVLKVGGINPKSEVLIIR